MFICEKRIKELLSCSREAIIQVSCGDAAALGRKRRITMDVTDKLNMTMLCDFYELTMGNGYFEAGLLFFGVGFKAICIYLSRFISLAG